MQNNKSSRFLAQADAIELYCKAKIDYHPENCVGILAMGSRVYILVQPTRDLEKIMSSIGGACVDNDSMHFLDALERADQFFQNKMLDKRLVVFAGGPIFWFKYHIKELATKLKVKGVAVDVVNFGDKLGPQVGIRMGPWDPSWNDNNFDYHTSNNCATNIIP
nr:hypothetical protein [Tanacetum cinerariifolium]